jgi:hypothetical protein
LGTVITSTDDETEEIIAANKAYSSVQIMFRFKQIHQNNKTGLYTSLIMPVLCNGSVTWTLTQMTEEVLCRYERKVLRRIDGPVKR